VDVAALVLDEAGVGSRLDPAFVSASGGDDPDRGASAVSCTCSTSLPSSFSSEGEGSFERTGETGEADMVAEERGTLGMSRCLVSSSGRSSSRKRSLDLETVEQDG
jgi:hypothetical protein